MRWWHSQVRTPSWDETENASYLTITLHLPPGQIGYTKGSAAWHSLLCGFRGSNHPIPEISASCSIASNSIKYSEKNTLSLLPQQKACPHAVMIPRIHDRSQDAGNSAEYVWRYLPRDRCARMGEPTKIRQKKDSKGALQ